MSTIALTSNTLAGTPAAGAIEYNGQFFATDSNASRAQVQRLAQATSVASTSGTSIDFTSLPAWAKRITVMFSGVSTSGTSSMQVQIGSGSFSASGYATNLGNITTASASAASYTSGFVFADGVSATHLISGSLVLENLTGNTWVCSGITAQTTGTGVRMVAGSIGLGGVLDRVRITTINGTDTFDAGAINIMYEG